jgi:hypothetical protein
VSEPKVSQDPCYYSKTYHTNWTAAALRPRAGRAGRRGYLVGGPPDYLPALQSCRLRRWQVGEIGDRDSGVDRFSDILLCGLATKLNPGRCCSSVPGARVPPKSEVLRRPRDCMTEAEGCGLASQAAPTAPLSSPRAYSGVSVA